MTKRGSSDNIYNTSFNQQKQ